MQRPKSNFFIIASPLLLILFIDGMGLGLVIPIINDLVFSENSEFLAHYAFTPIMHNVIYGGIISIFMLCWFFGAAILGDLSDKIGRKKSLLICLLGAYASYVLSAIAVHYSSLGLLVFGRIIAGFTSGSQTIAQAAIVDLSTPETKARNIGYILLSLSLGFIIGPLCGGVLSDNQLVAWFNFSTPFYFAATISAINIGLLFIFFKETFVSRPTTFRVNPYQAINIFISAFKNKSVRGLSIIFFIYIFGWSSFYSFISMYLLKQYQFTSTQVSLYMATMGIGFGVGTGYLVNHFAKLFPLDKIFKYASLLSAIGTFLIVIAPSILFNWLIVAPLTACIALSYSAILTLFSNQVDDASQGWVMGITGSIMAFVWALNGIIVGFAAVWNTALPLLISSIFLLLSVMITPLLFKNDNKTGTSNIRLH